MAKMIAVSFYFGEIDLPAFKRKFDLRLEQAFPMEVQFALQRGLMEYHWHPSYTLRLTPSGVEQANGVIALFYAGTVKAHLLNLAANQERSIHTGIPVRFQSA
jgi:oxygen-independent coproporphyrinogen-3 oxidase